MRLKLHYFSAIMFMSTANGYYENILIDAENVLGQNFTLNLIKNMCIP